MVDDPRSPRTVMVATALGDPGGCGSPGDRVLYGPGSLNWILLGEEVKIAIEHHKIHNLQGDMYSALNQAVEIRKYEDEMDSPRPNGVELGGAHIASEGESCYSET